LQQKLADLLKRLAKQNPDLKYTEQILVAFSDEETGMGQDGPDDQRGHRSFLSNQAFVFLFFIKSIVRLRRIRHFRHFAILGISLSNYTPFRIPEFIFEKR